MAMHTELWFPSVVWSSMVHSGKNDELKQFAYDLKKNTPSRVISNYGGYQSDNQDMSRHYIDWQIQLDNELPTSLNKPIHIPKHKWYRAIKGSGKLKLKIYLV